MEAEELIAAIVADPDDQAAWMIYADWLLERGHPRGELIGLGPLAAAGDNEARWQIQRLEIDEAPLLSTRLHERVKQWRFGFDRGFIRVAEFQTHGEQPIDAEAIAALCADPHAGLLSTIKIGFVEYRGPVDEITGLRQIVPSRADVGDLDRELARLRWLQRLDLNGVACPALSHTGLRHLTTDSHTCGDSRLDLPSLEKLEWNPNREETGFGNVLRGSLPRLSSLAIHGGFPATVAALAEDAVARQLEALWIRSEDVAILTQLVARATAFPNLKKLEIHSVYGTLEQAEVDALEAALERAFPCATIYVPWRNLSPDPVVEQQASADDGVETVEVDDQSRRPDGTIDAIARWNRGH